MAKIFFVMGKSASGKDTIYSRLLQDKELNLKPIVPYTTRPMREGEVEGENYFFTDESKVSEYEEQGKIVELRAYNTVHGIWKYYTVDDGQVKDGDNNYLVIGTLESYEQYVKYYGRDRVVPVYVQVEDGLRLIRAISRERLEKEPKYQEICRRFLADAEDFSEKNVLKLEIIKRYENIDLEQCIADIKSDILEQIKQ